MSVGCGGMAGRIVPSTLVLSRREMGAMSDRCSSCCGRDYSYFRVIARERKREGSKAVIVGCVVVML